MRLFPVLTAMFFVSASILAAAVTVPEPSPIAEMTVLWGAGGLVAWRFRKQLFRSFRGRQ